MISDDRSGPTLGQFAVSDSPRKPTWRYAKRYRQGLQGIESRQLAPFDPADSPL